jgi:collagen type I/II/III/V/XI/XXIV/XXVII alpha
MAKKKIDLKAKAKRQKIIAGVGGVILLGVLAFQVPRTMKMLNPPTDSSSSSSSAPATTTAATATPIAAPSLAGGNATAAPAAAPGGDGLTDPDAVPTPASGQLLAFGLFRSKDPFVQQLKVGATGSSGATGGAAPSGPTGAKGTTGATGVAPSGGGSSSNDGSSAPAASRAAVSTAVISINGAPESVRVGGQFPAASPVFKLVSLTKTGAKVGIAGGTLQTGDATVALKKNTPVTLLNTSDGTRYVLRLVSVS